MKQRYWVRWWDSGTEANTVPPFFFWVTSIRASTDRELPEECLLVTAIDLETSADPYEILPGLIRPHFPGFQMEHAEVVVSATSQTIGPFVPPGTPAEKIVFF